MDHEFHDGDIEFEDLLGQREELHLHFCEDSCYFRKEDVIAMAEALGLLVVEVE